LISALKKINDTKARAEESDNAYDPAS